MMEQRFNRLTEAEEERLALLAEECAEVIQVVGKILRHGYESRNPLLASPSNVELLQKEIGHVEYAIQLLDQAGDVSISAIMDAAQDKKRTIHRWLHHQD